MRKKLKKKKMDDMIDSCNLIIAYGKKMQGKRVNELNKTHHIKN